MCVVCRTRKKKELAFSESRKPTHTGTVFKPSCQSQGVGCQDTCPGNGIFARLRPREEKIKLSLKIKQSKEQQSKEKRSNCLKKNGYLSSFIHRTTHLMKKSHQCQQPSMHLSQPRTSVFPIYQEQVRCWHVCWLERGSRFAHKPISTFGQLMQRLKDRPLKERVQGVVYRIPYADSPVTYISETKNF